MENDASLRGKLYRMQLVVGNLQTRIGALERENAFLSADLQIARDVLKSYSDKKEEEEK